MIIMVLFLLLLAATASAFQNSWVFGSSDPIAACTRLYHHPTVFEEKIVSNIPDVVDSIQQKQLTCESMTIRSLKAGLLSTEEDILSRARQIDSMGIDSNSNPLLGVPVLIMKSRQTTDVAQRLSTAGALLFDDVEKQRDGKVRHPRDDSFPLLANCLPTVVGDESMTVAVASALSAVAAGGASAVVLDAPVSLSAAVLARQCASWAGVTTYDEGSSRTTATEGSMMYCASNIADIQTVAATASGMGRTAALLKASRGVAAASSTDNNSGDRKPLEGLKIAYLCDRPLHNLDVMCEETVMRSISAAADTFKNKLGATITRLKATKGPDGRLCLNEMAWEGCDILLSPAYPVGPNGHDNAGVRKPTSVDSADISLLVGRETLCMPCGVLAGEDDGYGNDVNDMEGREGLPVNMLLTALGPSIALGQQDKGYSQVARAGMNYEAITRWHSDLFAPGRSRNYVKEDMDDARESFGIYFVDSLLKYLGKKIQ